MPYAQAVLILFAAIRGDSFPSPEH
jgi:hypothetical protein